MQFYCEVRVNNKNVKKNGSIMGGFREKRRNVWKVLKTLKNLSDAPQRSALLLCICMSNVGK